MPETRIRARHLHCIGGGARTLSLQLPLLAREVPALAACHAGTLNLQLAVPLIVARPDHRTRSITWEPGEQEVFDLLRIELEVPFEGARHPAWLYIAHQSPHRATPRVHEVIAPYIDLQAHTELAVVLQQPCMLLPYGPNLTCVVA